MAAWKSLWKCAEAFEKNDQWSCEVSVMKPRCGSGRHINQSLCTGFRAVLLIDGQMLDLSQHMDLLLLIPNIRMNNVTLSATSATSSQQLPVRLVSWSSDLSQVEGLAEQVGVEHPRKLISFTLTGELESLS